MYCPRCGKDIPVGGRYCPDCGCDAFGGPVSDTGISTHSDVERSLMENKKSAGVAILLSVIVPGLGLIYLGRNDKGAKILIVSLVCLIAGVYVLVTWILLPFLWFYGIYESNRVAELYNRFLLDHHGQPPW